MKFRLKKLNFPNQRDIGDEITRIINILKREKNLNIKADVNKRVYTDTEQGICQTGDKNPDVSQLWDTVNSL